MQVRALRSLSITVGAAVATMILLMIGALVATALILSQASPVTAHDTPSPTPTPAQETPEVTPTPTPAGETPTPEATPTPEPTGTPGGGDGTPSPTATSREGTQGGTPAPSGGQLPNTAFSGSTQIPASVLALLLLCSIGALMYVTLAHDPSDRR